MNKQKTIIVALLLAGFFCNAYTATKTYQLQRFEQLVLAGHYQVNFTQANRYLISVTAKNLDNVGVFVLGNKLIAKQKSQFLASNPLFHIKISAPVLTKATLSGNYQADFVLPIGKSFALETQGQGDVILTGKLKQLSVNAKGSLVVNAKKACARAIEVQSIGNLNAIFCADNNAPFNRMIVGRADITIYGQPIFGKVLGFGTVNVRHIQLEKQ